MENPTKKSPFCGPGGWDFDFKTGNYFDLIDSCPDARSSTKVQVLLRPKAMLKRKVTAISCRKNAQFAKQVQLLLRPKAMAKRKVTATDIDNKRWTESWPQSMAWYLAKRKASGPIGNQ